MDKKQLSVLKKIYHHENGFYNPEAGRHETKIPAGISSGDLSDLERMGLKPNNFETIEHDHALERLLTLKNHPKISFAFVNAFFYKGITGALPRGRQPLMSYVFTRHLKQHSFAGKQHCEICGLPQKETIDKTNKLFTLYSGHSWNEIAINYLIDLEEIQDFEQPEVTEADKQKLVDLLKFIELAEANETPGKLEKRMAANKILPDTDKYKRYGILETLAECGILPNPLLNAKYDQFIPQTELWQTSRKLKGSDRSDIVLPLGAWKGAYGVNWQRYREIFEQQAAPFYVMESRP